MVKWIVVLLCVALPLQASQSPSLTPQAILDQTKAATVLVLAGEGAGRLHSVATGVIISRDGILLTALHAVKGALEVQVRTSDGEVFDRVQLLGTDERRDVAALKITAAGLHPLIPAASPNLTIGDPVYAVSNANGLSWSATEGILSAVRPAAEVPGAGTGFRLIQFTAPVAPGASGAPLVNRNGELIGIITSGKGNVAFAIPVDSVLGLPTASPATALGSGASLQLPAQVAGQASQSSAAIADANPQQILKSARTVCIRSKTSFLTVDTLDRALLQQKEWEKLGLTLVNDPRVADLIIEVDRPLFTYVHTFVITDKRTSIILGSGKQTAFDGTIASGGLAKDIVKLFATARLPQATKN